MPLKVGNCFFLANTGGYANPAGAHLMVCLVAGTPEGNAIIVPIVSRHEYSDTSCVLNVGDHPFLRHESCASYDFVRVVSMADIAEDIERGDIVLEASVSEAVLTRLQIGFVCSDEVEPWAYEAGYGDVLKAHLKRKGHL